MNTNRMGTNRKHGPHILFINSRALLRVAFFLLVFTCTAALAQSFSGTFSFGSLGDTSSFAYNGTAIANLTVGPLLKVGVTSSSSSGNFRATGWGTGSVNGGAVGGALDTGKYFEFTITAAAGWAIDNPTITFGAGRSSTGPRQFEWRSSVDSYASAIPVTAYHGSLTLTGGNVLQTPDGTSSYTGNTVSLTASGQTAITFRLYIYGAEASTGTGGLQGDMTFAGTLSSTASAPTVSTSVATSIGATTATLNGDVTSDGGSTITERGFVYNTTGGVTISDNKTTVAGTTGAFSLNLNSLAPNQQYFFKAYAINAAGTTLSSELDFTTTAASTPTLTPDTVSDFGNQEVTTTSSSQSYNLSGSALTPSSGSVAVSPPAGFEVSLDDSTWVANGSSLSVPYSGGEFGPTPIYVRFVPTAVQAYSDDITYSGGGVTTPPTTAVSGAGVYSTASDIVADGTFTAPQNIAYAGHQESDLTSASLAVAQFTLRDGGAGADADAAGTTLNSITFNVASSWNLQRVALYDGSNTELGEVAAASTVTFNGLNLATADGGTKTITLRASFKSTVTDNDQFSFTVSSATADASGSGFAAADGGGAESDAAGDANRIEVTATKLAFSAIPTTVIIGNDFSVSVQAQDANDNVDLDDSTSVTLSKASGSGTLSATSGLTQGLAAGAHTWSDVQINAAGAFTIQASGGSLTAATSGPINSALLLLEENFDYTMGDLITTHGWTAHSGGGSSPIQVASPGLSFGSYASSGIGYSAAITASGEDDNKSFDAQTSGSVYAAFMVNASAASTGGTYFFHFNQANTVFYGRVFLKSDGGSKVAFGLSKNNSSADSYTGFDYDLNTTHLVVVKYTFNPSSQDDTAALYINPASGSSEPTPVLGPLASATTDATGLIAVALRQGSDFPTVLVDGIRVGKSWATVVNHNPVAAADVAAAVHGQTISIPLFKLLANDTDADGDTLSITSVSGATLNGANVDYTAPGSGTSASFTYTVADGYGGTDEGTVNITLRAANVGSTITALDTVTEPGHVILTASGKPSTIYKVQASDNGGSSWSQIGTGSSAANGVFNFTDTTPNYPSRLYRLAE